MDKYFNKVIKLIVIFLVFSNSVYITAAVSSNYILSSFNELVVVEPTLTSELKFTYSIPFDYARTTVTGTASVTATGGMGLVQSGTGSYAEANLRNKYRIYYRPGQGAVGMITAIFSTGVSGSTQTIGVGNTGDGLFFGYNGTEFGILYRTSSNGSVQDNWIPRTSWNYDKMDGTGPSKMTLNPQVGNVYKIQYQWLGFGNIRFYIENPSDGFLYLVHMIKYSNSHTVTSLLNPTLQTTATVANSGNTGNISIAIGCMGSYQEGNVAPALYTRYSANVINVSTPNKDINYSYLGIENPIIHKNSTRINQAMVYPAILSASLTTARDTIVRLYLNPSGATGPYTGSIATNSFVNYDTNIGVISGGTILATYYIGGFTTTSNIYIDLTPLNLALAPSDKLVVTMNGIGGNTSANVSLSWLEDL